MNLSEKNLTRYSKYISRNYSGIIGLNVDGVEKLSQNDVMCCAGTWLLTQIKEGKQTINIIVGNEELLLYENDGEGITESCVKIHGEATDNQNQNMSDDEFLHLVYSLFEYLKINLEKNTVRFTYTGRDNSASYRISTI